MAKKVNITDAQKVVDALEARKAELAKASASDETEMAAVAYAAHTGDEKSAAKLETLRDRAIRRDVEARNLDSAIAEAWRRLAVAQDAEARAEEARIAAELVELAQIMRESGVKADRGLKLMIEGANELKRIIQAMQERGLNNPSAAQLQALGSRAIKGAIVDSPFAKDFEHISPRERQSFAAFTSGWASAIERNVSTKLEGGKNAA